MLEFTETSQVSHPLDIIEEVVESNDWMFDRRNDQEIAIQAPGSWCDYNLFFNWNEEIGAIHFTCAFDMRIPPGKRLAVYELLALINEKMWLGHFGLWEDEGLPMFRHSLPLRGSAGMALGQIEDILDTALIECERFYPVFQYVIWGGKSAEEAIAAAMIDTVGEA